MKKRSERKRCDETEGKMAINYGIFKEKEKER